MDWKQFIASVLGTIAWPFVVLIVLYLIRNQIRNLAERIEELTLPGGAGIKLAKQVEQVRNQAEIVEAEQKAEPPDVVTLDPRTLQLAEQFPEAALLEAFKELEGVLLQIRSRLPDRKPNRNVSEVVKYLADKQYITASTFELFQGLREARNSAAHAKGGNRLTPGEAIELVRQAKLLVTVLVSAANRLPPLPGA
jgi:hypothetical protein